ncbi:MAG: thioesterase family protein [Acidimicrobiia bacterium]|nr:thioesterase family protein [Acidimicrobiia bacterium]
MEALELFGLAATDRSGRWRLPVVPEICSGLGTLFGGAGLGACIEALEHDTGRPVVWATGQFLSFARPPSVLDVEVTEVVRGHHVSQARAVARLDGEEILTVNAALGTRPSPFEGSWSLRPEVPPPGDCPPRQLSHGLRPSIADRLDVRVANGRGPDDLPGPPGDGRSALWVRLPVDVSAAGLAIVGDYVPFGISQALGQRAGGNSLDNTLRVAHRAPTEWILADIRVHAVADGFGHGLVHLWSEDGVLLGSASQSTIVRRWRDQPVPPGDGTTSGTDHGTAGEEDAA